MKPGFKRIFISYSLRDAAAADRIVQRLNQSGVDVWIDRKEIRPGDSFLEKMSEGLEEAGYVLLLVSSASLQSQWVQREWMSTLASKDTVLVPARLENVQMPRLLRDILYIDFAQSFDEGLDALERFFRLEQEQLPASRAPAGLLSKASRREIRLVAKHCLDKLALRELLWDLDLPEGELAGESLHEQLLSLLHITAREGTLEGVLDFLESERRRCVSKYLEELRVSRGAD